MKKLISTLFIIILILSVGAALSGCDSPTVSVRSALDITNSFAGSRTVTIIYPLSVNIDAIKDTLVADSPASDTKNAEFSYIGVEEDGYHFELKLTFRDKDEYEEAVGELIGRSPAVILSRKDTALTSGVRMAEDFDVKELIPWIERDTQDAKETSGMTFKYDVNTVKIGAASYDTDSTIKINDCKGSRINSVSIKTSNDKEGNYDRTFVFSVPNETYDRDKEAVERYFLTNTSPEAEYTGWTSEGSNMVYTAIFNKLSMNQLIEVTSMLLDTDSTDIYYGDRDNSSTPLSEGMSFDETLDTFSFIGADNGFPKLEYSYSLPTSTTHGDGMVFEGGKWVSKGTWEEGVCKITLDSGSGKISIPDGVQYSINGINFYLVSLGDSRFRRSTEFLYSKTDGYDGMAYANKFFASKGMKSETDENDDSLICRVISEGTTDEITDDLVKLFGSGNFMAYRRSEGSLSLTVKTELSDHINISYMLNSSNIGRPMTYYVSSEKGDNIVSVSVDGSETAYTDNNASSLPIKEGSATVEYHGNIPITSHIVIYVIIGSALLILTAFVAIMLLKPKKRRRPADPLNNPEAYESDIPADADDIQDNSASDTSAHDPLAQTTTFSIFELNALSRNKKYVDEINKDIEERIQADSIRDQKNDIRARELEEMSRKVYGEQSGEEPTESDSSEQAESSEDQPSQDTAPQSDTENTGDKTDD